MSIFIATTFNFDKTIVDADSIEEAFDFMIDEFGIFSDPVVCRLTMKDVRRFAGRNILHLTVKSGYERTGFYLLGRRNMLGNE